MKLSHRLLYSFICAMLLMPALFSGCSESQAEPNTPDNTEQEDMPLTPAQDTEVPAYAAAYLEVAKAYEEEYAANPGDSDNPPRYALVDFDGDETPELVISHLCQLLSLYTFADETVYPLLEKVPTNYNSNLYTYLPGESILCFSHEENHPLYDKDGNVYYVYGGDIDVYYECFRLTPEYRWEPLYDQDLYLTYNHSQRYPCFPEPDHSFEIVPISYYYGSSELSEEDFNSMIVLDNLRGFFGTMTYAELEAALA